MPSPNTDLQSKINRAVRAVLIDQGAATADNCYAAPNNELRTLPNTSITTGEGMPFDGPGNWHFGDVRVTVRDTAVAQPGVLDQNRVNATTRFTNIHNALNRSDDETTLFYTAMELTRLGQLLSADQSSGSDPAAIQIAADNADMVDFTVMWWDFVGMGSATKAEDGTYWEREMQFSCVACNTGTFTTVNNQPIFVQDQSGNLTAIKIWDDQLGQYVTYKSSGRQWVESDT